MRLLAFLLALLTFPINLALAGFSVNNLHGFNAHLGNADGPIQFVGYTTTGDNTTSNYSPTVSLTSLTGGIDTRPRPGDVVIAIFSSSAGADYDHTVNSGYTELTELTATDGWITNLMVGYKRMIVAETEVSFTSVAAANQLKQVTVLVYRGVNAATIFDVTTTTATGINAGRPDAPSITPVTDGSWIVAIGQGQSDGTTTITYPTGFSNGTQNQQQQSGGGSVRGQLLTASRSWATGNGAINPAQFTGSPFTSSTTFSWAAVTLVLRN